jgi:hypothetical protein
MMLSVKDVKHVAKREESKDLLPLIINVDSVNARQSL